MEETMSIKTDVLVSRLVNVFMLFTLSVSILIVTPVHANSTITVNTNIDENNVGAGCSLREAITAANTDAAYGGCAAGSGADTITLPAGTYTLTIAGSGENANATSDLDITGTLTIDGAGAGTTIIQASTLPDSGIDRVFDIVGAGITVSFSGVTIANGKCISCNGGGIHNAFGNNVLTVTNSTFSNNAASTDYGSYGGAIYNGGTLTVTNSTFLGNSASLGGGISNGGALTVTNSTFSGNSAGFIGGGITNFGTFTVTNSTFSGNSAVTNGGAIYNGSNGSLVMHLINTILANSTSGGDCYSFSSGDIIATNTNNLIETNGVSPNKCGTPAVTTDPNLGALADNGGATQTFAITDTSSAYNAGDNATCAATDQRGVTRPQGAHCDIGAYELDITPPIVNSITRLNPSPTNLASVDFSVTFSEAVTGVDASDFSVAMTGGVSGATVSGVAGGPTIYTVTVNTGSGEGTLRLDVTDNDTIQDLTGNLLGGPGLNNGDFITGEFYTIDTTAPAVNTFTVTTPSNSLNIPIPTFTASDTGGVTGYLITESATVPSAGDSGWTGTAPTTYTVVSDGNYTLYPWAKDAADNVSAVFASPRTVVVDTVDPTVTSITRLNPSPTNLASVGFTVTFSKPVTGVDVVGPTFDDFSLTTSSGITGAAVTAVSGSGVTYTVTVNTGSGNGTIRLDVGTDGHIVDAALNPLAAGFTAGEVYSVIKAATFTDVPLDYWANTFIERLYNAGITGGCSLSPLMYCPETNVNRAQMAVFLLRGEHGSAYVPPAVGSGTGFIDVPDDYWAAAWIKQLAAEGITSGCGPNLYCPETSVTRDQMAVFLLRAEHGASYTPPPATGVFTDVPIDHWAAAWIEQLAVEGITGGCGVDTYCPSTPVTRAQMAVFLVRAFGLP